MVQKKSFNELLNSINYDNVVSLYLTTYVYLDLNLYMYCSTKFNCAIYNIYTCRINPIYRRIFLKKYIKYIYSNSYTYNIKNCILDKNLNIRRDYLTSIFFEYVTNQLHNASLLKFFLNMRDILIYKDMNYLFSYYFLPLTPFCQNELKFVENHFLSFWSWSGENKGKKSQEYYDSRDIDFDNDDYDIYEHMEDYPLIKELKEKEKALKEKEKEEKALKEKEDKNLIKYKSENNYVDNDYAYDNNEYFDTYYDHYDHYELEQKQDQDPYDTYDLDSELPRNNNKDYDFTSALNINSKVDYNNFIEEINSFDKFITVYKIKLIDMSSISKSKIKKIILGFNFFKNKELLYREIPYIDFKDSLHYFLELYYFNFFYLKLVNLFMLKGKKSKSEKLLFKIFNKLQLKYFINDPVLMLKVLLYDNLVPVIKPILIGYNKKIYKGIILNFYERMIFTLRIFIKSIKSYKRNLEKSFLKEFFKLKNNKYNEIIKYNTEVEYLINFHKLYKILWE